MFIASQTTFTEAEKIILGAAPAAKNVPVGLIAGTQLETAAGWRPVEKLMRGDKVYTYDGGLRAINRLDRSFVDAAEVAPEGLVLIPGGVLSNSDDLLVLPEQKLLIETTALGGVAALFRAADLIGQDGIHRVRSTSHIQVVRPVFDDEEVLWANSGLLFHCAASMGAPGFFPVASARDVDAIRCSGDSDAEREAISIAA